MQSNIKEEPKPNLDQMINNIQVELLVFCWTCNFHYKTYNYSYRIIPTYSIQSWTCCNPSFGLATKARACKSAGQEGILGGTSYTLGSVGECERMNPHTSKWAPIVGIGVPMDSWIFREQLQGSKPIALRSSLYHWESIET
jgi:hypothetical protein